MRYTQEMSYRHTSIEWHHINTIQEKFSVPYSVGQPAVLFQRLSSWVMKELSTTSYNTVSENARSTRVVIRDLLDYENSD